MRAVASFIFISLDGFYEGPNGELDWPIVDAEFLEFAARQLDEAGAIGFGRATYEHMAAYWPTEQAMVNDPDMTMRMNDKEWRAPGEVGHRIERSQDGSHDGERRWCD